MDRTPVSLRETENDRVSNPSIGGVFLLVAVVIVLWLATPFVVSSLYKPPTEAGPFGDLFGSINALFSGLAFAGLIYAILLQRRELELQRLELQATREEMKLARSEAERSASAQEAAARLSAITILVEHHRSQINLINSRLRVPDATHITGFRSREATDAEKSEMAALEVKVAEYVSHLEETYEHLRAARTRGLTLG
jgi:hypothetical protein